MRTSLQQVCGSDGNSPWLKVCKVGTHLVTAALLCPRFDRSIVWMEQHQVELPFRALYFTSHHEHRQKNQIVNQS